MREGLSVLLVEDSFAMQQLVTEVLVTSGYSVVLAGTVLEAQEKIDEATRESPDEQVARRIGAIILDGDFPYGDARDARGAVTHNFEPAAAVVTYARTRGLGGAVFLGFSTLPITREAIGLGENDGSFFDVRKSGGPIKILEILRQN